MTTNKVLVLGGGGLEHAIVWKLSQSNHVGDIYVHPGSYAIGKINKVKITSDIDVKDFELIGLWCTVNEIKLVVGPDGLADVLKKYDILCFGPTKSGARIEWDKKWSKDFMGACRIPTAKYQSFTDVKAAKEFILTAPFEALVVKASGLAAGKGVVVAANKEEACQAVDDILGTNFESAGNTIFIEEKLSGEEVSLLSFIDGVTVKVMLTAQGHKRLGNGDTGPNTCGMGAYCPCPLIDAAGLEFAVKEILQRAVAGFQSSNIEYCGVLHARIMLTPNGPKTLKFHCRFGDPETQVVLPLLESDLFEIMLVCCEQRLSAVNVEWRKDVSAVGVVMASKGYPETSTKGCEIQNLDVNSADHLIFHSGTAYNNGIYSDLRSAAAAATKYCEKITFSGAQFRTDIGLIGRASSEEITPMWTEAIRRRSMRLQQKNLTETDQNKSEREIERATSQTIPAMWAQSIAESKRKRAIDYIESQTETQPAAPSGLRKRKSNAIAGIPAEKIRNVESNDDPDLSPAPAQSPVSVCVFV